jgi:hypothetical protein
MATIASLLADHVTLRVRSVDRIFLHGYVPRLATQGLLIRFLLDQGFPIPSPALLGKIGRRYIDAVDRFAIDHEIPVVRFAKDACKEDVARPYLQRAEREGRTGVVLIGVAQEKNHVWRGYRRGGPDGHPHFEFSRQAAMVNHYYFYIYDEQWGPAFIKTSGYAPFGVWVYLTGTSGPSARPPARRSRSPPWITGSPAARTRRRWPRSVSAYTPSTCRSSSTAGSPFSPAR